VFRGWRSCLASPPANRWHPSGMAQSRAVIRRSVAVPPEPMTGGVSPGYLHNRPLRLAASGAEDAVPDGAHGWVSVPSCGEAAPTALGSPGRTVPRCRAAPCRPCRHRMHPPFRRVEPAFSSSRLSRSFRPDGRWWGGRSRGIALLNPGLCSRGPLGRPTDTKDNIRVPPRRTGHQRSQGSTEPYSSNGHGRSPVGRESLRALESFLA
jgi:hypothetical protein